MNKSLRVLSAAFASAMLLAASGEALAGGDWDIDDDYGPGRGYYGGQGYYGGYGHQGGIGYYGGYGHGYRGGYGKGRFNGWGGGYGGYGGYGYGGYGPDPVPGPGYGYDDDLVFGDVDVCFDGSTIYCTFEVDDCSVNQLEMYAFLTGGATCGGGGGGWYDDIGQFSDIATDAYYAQPLQGNLWQGQIDLDGYYGDFCDGAGAYAGGLDFRRMRLYIAGREFAYNDIPGCD